MQSFLTQISNKDRKTKDAIVTSNITTALLILDIQEAVLLLSERIKLIHMEDQADRVVMGKSVSLWNSTAAWGISRHASAHSHTHNLSVSWEILEALSKNKGTNPEGITTDLWSSVAQKPHSALQQSNIHCKANVLCININTNTCKDKQLCY